MDINKDVEYILDSVSGALVIDTDCKLKFMSSDLMNTIGVNSFDQIKDKDIRDVISTNTTYKVLETKEPQIAETYFVHGYTIVSNAYPVFKNGELIGAVEYDVFQNVDILQDFFDKISVDKDLKTFTKALAGRKKEKYSLDSIKGSSLAIKNMKNDIKMASRSNSTVLINGETGTGKELIAQAIHYGGHRALFEFVEINCTTIPSELFESELFGYEEGSFTGAKKGGKKGLAELADNGTLFLDEINALPINLQAKLLRFIQEKEFQRVGGNETIQLDVRIIAATNEDLSKKVDDGDFRKDLFYRLNVIEITAVPLRKRIADIPELVNYFIDKLNYNLGRQLESNQIKNIDTDALKVLMDYDWPGNIRELQNVVERAMNHTLDTTLYAEDFADIIFEDSLTELSIDENDLQNLTLKEMTRQVERFVINELINNQGMNVKETASRLGISRQMLHRKINDYNI